MKFIKSIFLISFTIPFITFATNDNYQGLSPNGQIFPISNPNKQMLPSPFPIYSNGTIVINHPASDFKKVNIPVDNNYQQNPGCYIMCYSHQKGLYKVDKDIFTQGMIRVAGIYKNTICQPTNAGDVDISAMKFYKDLCNAQIKPCNGQCWAGGDTGGWYGMQANQ